MFQKIKKALGILFQKMMEVLGILWQMFDIAPGACAIIVIIVVVSTDMIIKDHQPEMTITGDVATFQEDFQLKKGHIPEIGDYSIASFNGGLNWLAVEYITRGDVKAEVKIVGPAEEVYPGLSESLKKMDLDLKKSD